MRFSPSEIADCKASHRETTWRGDRHSFRLFAETAAILNINLSQAVSKDDALRMLASVVSTRSRDLGTPLSACEKTRSAVTWLIGFAWDPAFRMRCTQH
jgi:hypothetical protein